MALLPTYRPAQVARQTTGYPRFALPTVAAQPPPTGAAFTVPPVG